MRPKDACIPNELHSKRRSKNQKITQRNPFDIGISEGVGFVPYRNSTPIGFFLRHTNSKNTQSGFKSHTSCSPARLSSVKKITLFAQWIF